MGTTQTPTWTTGDRLRKAREWAGISSAEMAERLGVSRNTVSNYEHGRTQPSLSALRVWSEETDVPLFWILDYKDERDLIHRCFLSDGHEVHYPTLPFAA